MDEPVLVLQTYGFYFTDSLHEVPHILQSVHTTKQGAYKAMRRFMLSEWERMRDYYVQHLNRREKKFPAFTKLCRYHSYKVLPHTLKIYE